MSSDISEEQQIFTITIRTTSKKTKLDSYSQKSFYTPKVTLLNIGLFLSIDRLGMLCVPYIGVCGVSLKKKH
mgnify:CR=1 FL=1